MKCKLCLVEKQLIKKSHIIPDFMYNGLFDENHKMYKLDIRNPERKSTKPTGLYEKYILCSECDREVIGKYETYASNVIFNKIKKTAYRDFDHIISLDNIDYGKFKLFLISIIWRAHISDDIFFKAINLGKHFEIMRKMILDNDPGDETIYETVIFYNLIKEIPSKSLIPAKKFKSNSNSSYLIHINDLSIYYNISEVNKIEFFGKAGIFKDNRLDFYLANSPTTKELFQKSTGIKFEF